MLLTPETWCPRMCHWFTKRLCTTGCILAVPATDRPGTCEDGQSKEVPALALCARNEMRNELLWVWEQQEIPH